MPLFASLALARQRLPVFFGDKTQSRLNIGHWVNELVTHPVSLFWLFASAHLFLWTLIPTLTSPNAPLDVIEGYVWGREWLLGTYKHPPMQAWCLETLAALTGRAPFAHFLASQIAIVAAFWAVWKMGLRIMAPREALVSALLLEGIVYYNYTSPEFNPNVLQLPFWALIGLYFHKAVKDNRLSDWLLLGFFGACGLYTKYSTVLLLVVLAALLAFHPESRRRLREKGPYAALLCMFLLFLPHLIWFFESDFLPVDYFTSRIADPTVKAHHLAHPLQFLMSQTLAVLPLLGMITLLLRVNILVPARRMAKWSFDSCFMAAMVFGPMVILLMVSATGVKVHDMWGTPLWGYASLWLLSRSHLKLTMPVLRRFVYGWVAVFTFALVAFAGTNLFSPYLSHGVQRVHFPGKSLAETVESKWDERTITPLEYVVGDTWLSGNIAYYAESRPHVLIKGDYKIASWVSPQDVKDKGAVLVWCIANCGSHDFAESKPDFVKEFPNAEIQQPLTIKRQTAADVEPVTIGWAIQKPKLALEARSILN